MRRFTSSFRGAALVLCVFAFICSTFSYSQLTTAEEKGLPPNSIFHLGEIDAVNLQNGNLHISIPILSIKQRGGGTLNWKIVYDSPTWTKQWMPDHCPTDDLPIIVWLERPNPQPIKCPTTGHFITVEGRSFNSNWRFATPAYWDVFYTEHKIACPIPIAHTGSGADDFLAYMEDDYQSNWYAADPEGTAHPLSIRGEYYSPDNDGINKTCLGSTNSGPALDGSGIFYDLGPEGYLSTSRKLYTKDGTVFPWIAGQPHDANGNIFNDQVDTLNRNPVTTTKSADLVAGQPQYVIYTVHDSNGTSQQYRVDYQSVHLASSICSKSGLGGGLPPNPDFPCSEAGSDIPAISRITLPNQKAYVFTYNENTPGELSRIDLPTGGSIEYTYADFYQSQPPVRTSQGLIPLNIVGGRAVATRKVTIDGRSYTWTYVPELTHTTVTDPEGNVQIHQFIKIAISNGSQNVQSSNEYESSVTYQDSNGHTLRTVQTDYTAEFAPLDQMPSNVRPIRTTTTLDNGLISKKETDYEMFSYSCTPCQFDGQASRYNPTEVREYDYGQGAPGPLLRKTDYTYLHNNNPDYVPLNIVDKESSATVYDGNGNIASKTLYEYDNYSYPGQEMKASGAVQHDPAYDTGHLLRGNLTSTSSWLNTSNTYLTTTRQYDDAGNVLSVVDPQGGRTDYDFTDSWTNAACAPAGAAKLSPSKITNALGQSAQLQYNSCTGTINSSTDANGKTTSITYDAFSRPLHISFPDGGAKDTCYTDDPNGSCSGSLWEMIETTATGSTSIQTTTKFDGLGQLSQTQLNTDPSGVTVTDTLTNDRGQVVSVSNPYRSTGGPAYETTSYHYDALGRKDLQTNPDGTTRSWVYSGNVTTFYDESNNIWQQTTDALGRLTKVGEPSGATTSYTYDALGNLTQAIQFGLNGETPRTRTFTYDSLSRLLTSTNPETGTICYGTISSGTPSPTNCNNDGYDANGNLLHKTDALGLRIDYTYDALNRMLTKYSPNGLDVDGHFIYDQGANGIGRLWAEYMQGSAGTLYSYDAMGRVTGTQWFDYAHNTWTTGMGAQYDLAGNITQLTYPSGRVLNQAWDGAGRLQSVTDATPGGPGTAYFSPTSGLPQYTAAGALANAKLGNGVTQTFNYNDRLQPCRSRAFSPLVPAAPNGGGNLYDRQSFYDSINNFNNPCGNETGNNGNIYAIVDNLQLGLTQSFGYDSLNRLTSAFRSDGAYNHTYNYDSFGNMLPHDNVYTTPNYSIDPATNRLLLNNTDLHYLPNGWMDASPGHSYWWTAEGNLRSIDNYQTGSYLYNAQGQRTLAVRNDHPSTTNYEAAEYVYFGGQPMAEYVLSANTNAAWQFTDDIYAAGQKIARVDGTGTTHYYLNDNLGTMQMELNADGTTAWQGQFTPFGQEIVNGTPLLPWTPDGSSNRYKFTGKERDTESGLDYFGARYYASSMGRWMSPDWADKPETVPYSSLDDPQTLNLYQYVRNNPLSTPDIDGHGWWKDFGNGLANATYRPLGQAIAHPIMTAEGLGHAIAHPIATAEAIGSGIKSTSVSVMQGDGTAIGTAVGTVGMALIPGVGEVGDGAEATVGISDAALAGRAAEIHGALDPIAQSMRTTAAASVTDSNGVTSVMVGSSQNTLSPAQRALLGPGETAVTGAGHAETTVINAAQAQGMQVNAVAASRTICATCQQAIKDAGARAVNPQ